MKILSPKLKSNDDAVLTVMRQSRQIRNSQHLQALQPFLGVLVSHFCENKISSKFISEVVKLSQLKEVDYVNFGYPLLEHISGKDDFSYLKQVLPACFLHAGLTSLTPGGQPPSVSA